MTGAQGSGKGRMWFSSTYTWYILVVWAAVIYLFIFCNIFSVPVSIFRQAQHQLFKFFFGYTSCCCQFCLSRFRVLTPMLCVEVSKCLCPVSQRILPSLLCNHSRPSTEQEYSSLVHKFILLNSLHCCSFLPSSSLIEGSVVLIIKKCGFPPLCLTASII